MSEVIDVAIAAITGFVIGGAATTLGAILWADAKRFARDLRDVDREIVRKHFPW